MKKGINSQKAPKAIGPYSHAVRVGDTVYVSGQLGVDPATGKFAEDNIKVQTIQALKNIETILAEEGYCMDDVVKTTVFMRDLNDFEAMNIVYHDFFRKPYPARSAFQVAKLPKDARIEIEAIAAK